MRRGRSSTEKVTLRNTGSAPVTVRLSEQSGLSPQLDSGSLTSVGKVVRVEGDFSPLAFDGHGPKGQVPEAPASPWVELGDYPTRIMDNAVAEEDGTVYSVGGVDGIRITNTAYRYDPASRTWTAIAPLPDERESAAAAVIDGLLYVATGWPGARVGVEVDAHLRPGERRLEHWCRRTGRRRRSGPRGPRRKALPRRRVHQRLRENAVQRYDPETDTWDTLAPYPEGRGHLACGELEGQIYCTGGIARTSTQVTNRTYAYDPATDTWTRKADLPVNLWGMAYTASYDRLLVSGGVTGSAVTNQGWIYDPDEDAWAPLPAARHVLYRGGSACGLFRIGGSVGGFTPGNATQMLPTYGACRPEDVPWLSEDRDTMTIPPGRSVSRLASSGRWRPESREVRRQHVVQGGHAVPGASRRRDDAGLERLSGPGVHLDGWARVRRGQGPSLLVNGKPRKYLRLREQLGSRLPSQSSWPGLRAGHGVVLAHLVSSDQRFIQLAHPCRQPKQYIGRLIETARGPSGCRASPRSPRPARETERDHEAWARPTG